MRLRALEESPDAFSPTLEETAGFDAQRWRESARRFAAGRGAMFIARPELGLMSATVDADGLGYIGAMWLAPEARGQGLGGALLDTGIEHLEGFGCTAIELSVTETNEVAQHLYVSRGFAFNGNDEPLRPGSALKNLFMRRVH